ncbi:hypothetical protein E8E13_011625 [Curvularia kusanoi]|uniref:Protein kinase domain-containing protein n=1 Tax=Curvularia kusanoi TaxID=90978 RepID=A0A9P4TP69_CURKU|nr:hypothetical protein E8E13_011625 [Curvularia kusanoi]
MVTAMADTEEARLQTARQVADYMDEKMAEMMFRGEEQRFLPKPFFDIVTSKRVVRRLISADDELNLEEREAKAFTEQVLHDGLKMYATCIFSEMSLSLVKNLFAIGLTDKKFPLKEKDCPKQYQIRSFRNGFIMHQKLFNPAFISPNSELNWDKCIAKPINFTEDEESLLGSGTFGNVYEIELHSSQHSLTSGCNKDGTFAMKVTSLQGTREVSFHRAMTSIPPHNHLLRCLASFVFGSKYHMIYEKADSDVEKFMKSHPDPQRSSGMTATDLAQQLFGLVSALAAIHNQNSVSNEKNNNLLSVPPLHTEKAGYIHDIKPENILVFAYKQNERKRSWFRLSDFSCAKINDVQTSVSGNNRNSWKTKSKSGTPIYRAPESYGNGGTSRPYDLWSLGCVYLEFLVWFLEGYASLDAFRTARECEVSPGGREDEGFYFKPTESDDFRLRDVVLKKITSVRKLCRGPLVAIADTVPKLLQIDPRQRPTAEKLVKTLQGTIDSDELPSSASRFAHGNASRKNIPAVSTYESGSEPNVNVGGPVLNIVAPS